MAALANAAAPGRLVLSSDCGVFLLPPPVEGLRSFLLLMEACGVRADTLSQAVRQTPANMFTIAVSAPA